MRGVVRTSQSIGPNQVADNDGHMLAQGLALLACFIAAIPPAIDWPRSARLFPLVIAPAGLLFVAMALTHDIRARWRGTGVGLRPSERQSWLFVTCLLLLIVAAPLVGQPLALTLFIAGYLIHVRKLHNRWLDPWLDWGPLASGFG